MTFTEQFLGEAAEILKQIDVAAVERLKETLSDTSGSPMMART